LEIEGKLIALVLTRQAERNPMTVEDVIEFMARDGRQVDRFWVYRFVEHNADKLALHEAVLLEEARQQVSADDLTRYFDVAAAHLNDVPSLFVWNADETRIGSPKKQHAPQVIVSTDTPPGITTVAAMRDDAQMTLLTAISAFGDSIPPLIISKNQTFEKVLLADRELYEGHDYTIRTAPKTFITEVLFIDWLKTMFLPRIEDLRAKAKYAGPVILLLDGHSTHLTDHVVGYAGSERILIIRLVPHSSHLSQPLDLCVFGLFKILYKKEAKPKGMKGETSKIYRALLAFYKATIIPMVRWSFRRAGFNLNSTQLLGPLTVNPAEVLERIAVPEMALQELVSLDPSTAPASSDRAIHRRARIPAPLEFAVSLKAYVDKVSGTCPLCGHSGQAELTGDEERRKD
jgi:hypothetical protein